MWYVYILRCSDDTLYTGICKDLDRRLAEHNSGSRGAKYTRGRRPLRLFYSRSFSDRGEALKKEAAIKKLSKAKKEKLLLSE